MNKTFKHGLKGIAIYSTIFYIIIVLFFYNYYSAIPFSIILGLFYSILDSINTQLRKLNGEKFDNLE